MQSTVKSGETEHSRDRQKGRNEDPNIQGGGGGENSLMPTQGFLFPCLVA